MITFKVEKLDDSLPSVRVPKQLKLKLAVLAGKERRSLSDFLRLKLKEVAEHESNKRN